MKGNPAHRNGQARSNGQPETPPDNELEVYDKAIEGSHRDEFLGEVNTGLGKVTDPEYWQNAETFHSGMYGRAAFKDLVERRAVLENKEETQRAMALDEWERLDNTDLDALAQARGDAQGWEQLSPGQREEIRDEWIQETGETIWQELTPKERRHAVVDVCNAPAVWDPPHFTMLTFRTEHSRSKGAHLIDNLFGRVKEEASEVRHTAQDKITDLSR